MIKVLIVDDSALIRKLLTDIITSDNRITVVGTASNGKEALEKIETLKPDIVTLDIEMPVMNGIATLKQIMLRFNIPVIIISSLTTEGAELTLKALDEGAIDFLPKPENVFTINQNHIKEQIIMKIIAGSKSKAYWQKHPQTLYKPQTSKNILETMDGEFSYIVTIGTSTGGPRALQSILAEIPWDINATILVVQHMPANFTKSLANRLDSSSNLKIKEAEDGDILQRGHCYIAPGDYHMLVAEESNNLVIKLNQEPQIMGLRPTVDKLMDSVSKITRFSKIAIILTGMGSDGKEGIIKMKESNSYTIAQDESTSVVYGMPKAAISTNYIDEILPLDKIANRIINKVGV